MLLLALGHQRQELQSTEISPVQTIFRIFYCWPHNSLNRPNHSFQFQQLIFWPQSRVSFLKANIGFLCKLNRFKCHDSTFPGPIPISAKPVVLLCPILKPHTCDGCPRTMRHLRCRVLRRRIGLNAVNRMTGMQPVTASNGSAMKALFHSTATPLLKRWQFGKGIR